MFDASAALSTNAPTPSSWQRTRGMRPARSAGLAKCIAPQFDKFFDGVKSFGGCAHETDSQARPVSAAGLERRQGRSAAYSHRAEPEAARQASLPCPATSSSDLPSIGAHEWTPKPTQGRAQTSGRLKLTIKLCNRDRPSFATQSTLKRTLRARHSIIVDPRNNWGPLSR